VAYHRRAAPLGDTRVSGELVVVTSTYGRDELGTRPMDPITTVQLVHSVLAQRPLGLSRSPPHEDGLQVRVTTVLGLDGR
jgi:hypothetical protein